MGVEKQNVQLNEPLEQRCISYGVGSSKKEGEQNAAKMSLIIHGVLNQDQYSQTDIYNPPWDKILNKTGTPILDDKKDNNQNDYDSD
jgi:hypothetical protein